MKNIQLSEQKARELYQTASSELKQILEENFTKELLSGKITDRIKCWADVERELGHPVNIYPFGNDKQLKALSAFNKIQSLSKVLNEGWKPDFSNTNEYKWYPYFRKDARSGWVFYSAAYGRYGAAMGSGFYFKTEELAKHAAKYFMDVYLDYLPE
jgi:hypothetical protein